MKLLLDTHVLIWSQVAPEMLSRRIQNTLTKAEHQRYVHSVSALEIARLAHGKRLILKQSVRAFWELCTDALLANVIDLNDIDAIEAYDLPGTFHKDPIDRMLVACARNGGYTLLTADADILEYEHVTTLDAS